MQPIAYLHVIDFREFELEYKVFFKYCGPKTMRSWRFSGIDLTFLAYYIFKIDPSAIGHIDKLTTAMTSSIEHVHAWPRARS